MHAHYFTLLLLLPSACADVDCRTACHSCQEKDDLPQVLEVYCSMCQECKQRRKERLMMDMQRANDQDAEPTSSITISTRKTFPLIAREIDDDATPLSTEDAPEIEEPNDIYETTQVIPEGCPTAAPCSDNEEEPSPTTTTTTTTTTRTTTTTTTAPVTCPPIKPCKKKPKTTAQPCCPQPFSMPCCPQPLSPPCVQLPCFMLPPPPPYPYPYSPQFPMYPYETPLTTPSASASPSLSPMYLTFPTPKTTDGDYIYMYVGVPKKVLRRRQSF